MNNIQLTTVCWVNEFGVVESVECEYAVRESQDEPGLYDTRATGDIVCIKDSKVVAKFKPSQFSSCLVPVKT